MIQLRNRYGIGAVSGFISAVCPDVFGLRVCFKAVLPYDREFEGHVTLFQVKGRWAAAVCDREGPQPTGDVLWILPKGNTPWPAKSEVRTILAFLVESINEGVGPHLPALQEAAWKAEAERRRVELQSARRASQEVLARYQRALDLVA